MCECINLIKEKLAESNTQFVLPMFFDGKEATPFITTEKIDKRKRLGPIKLQGGYCPFCGAEYIKEEIGKT